MCKETGWTVEYVLHMPARRFFALKKCMFDLMREEKYSNLMDLCDIGLISVAQPGYAQELKDFYRSSYDPEWSKKRLNSRCFAMDNEEDRKKVDAILSATFRQKAQLMGLATNG